MMKLSYYMKQWLTVLYLLGTIFFEERTHIGTVAKCVFCVVKDNEQQCGVLCVFNSFG